MNRVAVARELMAIAKLLTAGMRYQGEDRSKAFMISTTIRVPVKAKVSVNVYDDGQGKSTMARDYTVDYDSDLSEEAIAKHMAALLSSQNSDREPVFAGGSNRLIGFANRFENKEFGEGARTLR